MYSWPALFFYPIKMPRYEFKKLNKTKEHEKGLPCLAFTMDKERCKILVTNSPDDLQLCHVHHPERKFQRDLHPERY